MTPEVGGIRATVALAIGAVVLGCGSAAQTPATVDRPSVSVVTDGVNVRLTLEQDATGPAVPLEAIVVVHNAGPRPIRWRSGGCSLVSAVTIAAVGVLPAPAPRLDREATFVARVTDGAESPKSTVTLTSEPTVDRRACQIDHGFAELAPGARLTERAEWPATTSSGAPMAPGPYRVTGSLPMLTPAAPLVPAEFRADRDLRSIVAELALDVTAGGPERLRAGQHKQADDRDQCAEGEDPGPTAADIRGVAGRPALVLGPGGVPGGPVVHPKKRTVSLTPKRLSANRSARPAASG